MENTQKITFIVNPISGVGKQKRVEQLVANVLDQDKFLPSIVYTQHAGHATNLAKEAIESGANIIVAVGGDGSVNEVGASLVGSNSKMGILPTGSGNGLARHLGIPMDLSKAMNLLNHTYSKVIDTFSLGEHFCAGVAGVGLDAHIGWEFSKLSKRGFKGYLKIFLRDFFSYKGADYNITVDGNKYQHKAMLISIANSSQYGNNAYISPEADIQDGELDVCVLKPFNKWATPLLAIKMFNKTIHKSKYLNIYKGKVIEIEQAAEIAHIAGEPIKLGKHIFAKINPGSLSIICPESKI